MNFQKIFGPIFAFALILALSTPAFANNGWDYMGGELRVDLPEVSSAKDYRVWIATNSVPNLQDPTSSTTSAWLGVYILPAPTFFQVGILVDNAGFHWFAMTDGPQISCLQGNFFYTTLPYKGCMGDPGVWISPPRPQQFELLTYSDGYWYARVWESDGTGHDVAKIPLSSVIINRANATFEQAWAGYDSNPYNNALFTFSHPQYMKPGVDFQDWPNSKRTPSSTPQTSYIFPAGTNGDAFCTVQYGAVWNFGNDPRGWYAGTKTSSLNIQCRFRLFQFSYVPIIYKSP